MQAYKYSLWESCLFKLYRDTPAGISIIKGDYKTGKTNFALFLAFDVLKNKLGIIKDVGTNIQVFQDPSMQKLDSRIKYIDNFVDLETFLFRNKRRKIFIYDEAIKSTPSRRAMSKLNVKWLEYVPELSKAKCHMFVITQSESFVEKLFLHEPLKKAEWIKQDRKTVKLKSPILREPITFYNVPATSLIYDPDLQAVWRMEPKNQELSLTDEIRIAFDYADGLSTDKIVQKYEWIKTRRQAVMWIQKGIKQLRRMLFESSLVPNADRERKNLNF